MRSMSRVVRVGIVCLLALVVSPGCATTKSVLHKATFGLVGEESPSQKAAPEAKQVEDQRREEEKARVKQQKESLKAEQRARKDAEEAQKKEKGEGWLSKATFGLFGGKEKSEEQAAAQAKQAEAKQAEKQRVEEEKTRVKQQKESLKAEQRARKDAEEAQKKEKGEGWLSKATFGLFGGKEKSEEQAAAQAKQAEAKQAEKQRREEEKAREKQEKQARREAKKTQKAAKEPESKEKGKGWLAKATFGLIGGKREAEAPSQEQPTQAQKPAPEEKPSVPKEEGEKQAGAEAAKTAPEASPAEAAPKKRTLMSKLTFGLICGNGKPAPEAAPETPLSPKAQKKTAKAEAKQAARAEEDTHRERVAAVPDPYRKLARLTFHTDIRQEEQFTGGAVGVADRESYTEGSYGICDIGTVRIAVRDMTFQGAWRTARVVVDSTRKESFTGSSGIGNRRFTYVYDNGVTKCTFGSVPFSISRNVLTIGGTEVPMDQGRRLVVVSADGKVEGAYPI